MSDPNLVLKPFKILSDPEQIIDCFSNMNLAVQDYYLDAKRTLVTLTHSDFIFLAPPKLEFAEHSKLQKAFAEFYDGIIWIAPNDRTVTLDLLITESSRSDFYIHIVDLLEFNGNNYQDHTLLERDQIIRKLHKHDTTSFFTFEINMWDCNFMESSIKDLLVYFSHNYYWPGRIFEKRKLQQLAFRDIRSKYNSEVNDDWLLVKSESFTEELLKLAEKKFTIINQNNQPVGYT